MGKKFYGLYCGYSQEDIEQIGKEIKEKGCSYLMDNYILRKTDNEFICIMEDKWEAEPFVKLHGQIEEIILNALSLEFTNKKSKFKTFDELINYMMKEEEQDMESYILHEEEWEY